jgi:hypothetical protein
MSTLSEEEIARAPGVGTVLAKKIYQGLHGEDA